jgi:hypothetical protein
LIEQQQRTEQGQVFYFSIFLHHLRIELLDQCGIDFCFFKKNLVCDDKQSFSYSTWYYNTTVMVLASCYQKKSAVAAIVVLLFINYFVFKDSRRRYEAWTFYRNLYCLLFPIYCMYLQCILGMHIFGSCLFIIELVCLQASQCFSLSLSNTTYVYGCNFYTGKACSSSFSPSVWLLYYVPNILVPLIGSWKFVLNTLIIITLFFILFALLITRIHMF